MGKWHSYTYTCTHSLYGHYLYQLYDGISDNFLVNDRLIRSDLHYFPILGPEGNTTLQLLERNSIKERFLYKMVHTHT